MSGIGIDTRFGCEPYFGDWMIFQETRVVHVLYFCIDIVQVNPDVIGTLEEAGLKFVGKDESGKRMEVSSLLADV